ncbi:MAG: glycosyltransferase family 2 protein [Phycisphaeraceae bacterium]
MKLLIVIVCYKAADLTIDCLRSLSEQAPSLPGVKVTVCENGTGDESVRTLKQAIVREGWDDWVTLKPIHPNRGFSGGNNAVLDEALQWDEPPELFMLLNADTLVRPGALVELLRAAERHPEAGIISPRLEWRNGTPQISCFRFHNPLSELIDAAQSAPVTWLLERFNVPQPVSETSVEVQWTSFACALIRREVFERVGTLDEGFFLYFDDPDFCRRAWRAGWRVRYWPAARVVHLRGRSNPVKSLTEARGRRPNYYYASRARYLAKYYGRAGLWLSNGLWTFGRGISLVREWVGRKAPQVCEREWCDIWTGGLRPLRLSEVNRQTVERTKHGADA